MERERERESNNGTISLVTSIYKNLLKCRLIDFRGFWMKLFYIRIPFGFESLNPKFLMKQFLTTNGLFMREILDLVLVSNEVVEEYGIKKKGGGF